MVEYQLITSSSASALVESVNLLAEAGWLPQGGVSVTTIHGDNGDGGSDFHYAQAMTRTPQPTKEKKR